MFPGDWVDFFEKAGIPSNEAATYALIFTQNRIQKNMLSDLNKEYLKDMGISLLGDVIAILKHAKHVHENNVRIGLLETSVVSLESSEEDTLNPAGGTSMMIFVCWVVLMLYYFSSCQGSDGILR